jgi:hypothetical protein
LPEALQPPLSVAPAAPVPPGSPVNVNPYAAVPAPTPPAFPGLFSSLATQQPVVFPARDRGAAPTGSVPSASNPVPAVPGGVSTAVPSPVPAFSFLQDARPLFVEPAAEPAILNTPATAFQGGSKRCGIRRDSLSVGRRRSAIPVRWVGAASRAGGSTGMGDGGVAGPLQRVLHGVAGSVRAASVRRTGSAGAAGISGQRESLCGSAGSNCARISRAALKLGDASSPSCCPLAIQARHRPAIRPPLSTPGNGTGSARRECGRSIGCANVLFSARRSALVHGACCGTCDSEYACDGLSEPGSKRCGIRCNSLVAG